MSPVSFATSPSATGDQRKFVNPTSGWVGANVFAPDGKPTAVGVEPGGEVWLTEAEERMTAEAPRMPQDNPFIKEWEEPVEWNEFNEVTRTVMRQGTLVLADEPPRPTASSRFVPPRMEEPEGDEIAEEAAPEELTVTGAPEIPEQPPVQGQPAPDEVVGTPEAPAKNDEALAMREPTAEQPTRRRRPPPTGGPV